MLDARCWELLAVGTGHRALSRTSQKSELTTVKKDQIGVDNETTVTVKGTRLYYRVQGIRYAILCLFSLCLQARLQQQSDHSWPMGSAAGCYQPSTGVRPWPLSATAATQ